MHICFVESFLDVLSFGNKETMRGCGGLYS
jgi:hypothetical protein